MQYAATLKALAALKPAALRADLGFGKSGSFGFDAGRKTGRNGDYNFTDVLDLSMALTSWQVEPAAMLGHPVCANCTAWCLAVCLLPQSVFGLGHYVTYCISFKASKCIVQSFHTGLPSTLAQQTFSEETSVCCKGADPFQVSMLGISYDYTCDYQVVI